MSGDVPAPIDALAWLQARGVERQPIRVAPDPAPGEAAAPPHGPPPARREVANLALPPPTHPGTGVGAPPPPPGASAPDAAVQPLTDEVAAALAFVRRSTAGAMQSRGRLAEKLAERDVPTVVVELALDRAEEEGLVDDALLLPLLVEERREQGHAPRRIREDLRQRGFSREQLDAALAEVEDADPHAAVFGLARERAEQLTGLAPETAHRRLVAWLARRGYPEAMARKAASDAIWTTGERARTATR